MLDDVCYIEVEKEVEADLDDKLDEIAAEPITGNQLSYDQRAPHSISISHTDIT